MMNKKCKLVIRDEVNLRFEGLDPETRRKLKASQSYFMHSARHTPAYKLGRWDGKVTFCDVGGRSFVSILPELIPVVQEAGYEIELVDQRFDFTFEFDKVDVNSYSHVVWPEKHVCAGESLVLRDHQPKIVNEFLKNPQALQEIATGAGKTICIAIMADKASKYGRTLIIVPNKDLVVQTERDFLLFGLDVGVYYGDRKEPGRTHTICTWQSIEATDRKHKKYDSETPISVFTDGLAAVIVDEVHGGKAPVLKKHLTTSFANVPLRWGLTGTIPLEEFDVKTLVCSLGPVVNFLSAKELQDRGVLSNLDITVAQINDTLHCPQFGSYQEELTYLVTNPARVEFLAEYIKPKLKDGNTLILVDRISTGEQLLELLPDAVFICGKVKSSVRKEEYDSFSDMDNKPIIATAKLAAVGLDIPRIFNVFLIESGKSYIRTIQSIGRGIRKAEDKDYVKIYDLASTCKYSRRHLTERKRFYKKAQYPFKVVKIQR